MVGIPSTQQYDKYLGLLALVGKSRNQAFKNIKDRVWRRLGESGNLSHPDVQYEYFSFSQGVVFGD
jgi:hypothetical protein